jgi:autotransporter-associated beta strand protein
VCGLEFYTRSVIIKFPNRAARPDPLRFAAMPVRHSSARSRVLIGLVALAATALTAAPASAQTNYFWNAPTGDTGTWDTSATNWSSTSGGPVDSTWPNTNSSRANFGNTAGTVTIAPGGVTAFGVNFLTTGYTITGDTLTLAGTGGVIDTGGVNATVNSIIAGSVGLTKTNTGTLTLGAVNAYTGQTTIAQGTLALGVTNALPTTTTLQIGTFSGTSPNFVSGTATGNFNLGSFSQTVGSLYTFSKSSAVNTITIGSGQTLTVSNAATGNPVLTAFGAYDTASSPTHNVTFTGGGSFVVNTPSAVFQVGQATLPSGFPAPTTQGSLTTVTMTNLSSFTATVSAFRVGDFTGGGNTGSTTLTLAPTSTITATDFIVASGRNTNSTTAGIVTVNLGSGTNTIDANSIYIGGDVPSGISNPRSQGLLKFNAANGSLTIRAQNGTDAANLFLGLQRNGSGAFARNNSISLNNHAIDLLLNTFQVGGLIGGTSTANQGAVAGTFGFSQGTVSATTLQVGNRIGSATGQNNTGGAAGTVNVGGGTLTVTGSGAGAISIGVNTMTSTGVGTGTQTTDGTVNVSGGALTVPNGGITLATSTGSYSGAGSSATFTTTGTLGITGGTVTVGGDIVKGAATSPGSDTATLTLNGATAVLDLGGHRIGGTTSSQSIDALNLQVGTLQNVLEINNGAGLTKNTTGTLTLAGTNTYTGPTTVTNGTLAVGSNAAIPTGATAGNVVLDGGSTAGVLDLNGFNPTINGLVGAAGSTLGQVLNSATSTTSTLSVGNNDVSTSFAGVITDNGGTGGTVALTKIGTGTLTLTGANTYTGATTINAGTLAIGTGGSLAAGSAVAVNNGGTLAGTGTVNGTVSVASGGALAPGSGGAGALIVGGNTTLNNGAKLSISAAAVGNNTSLTVQGSTTTVDFKTGSILDLSLISGFGSAGNYTIVSMPTGSGANVLLDGVATTDGQVLGTFVQGTGASGAVTITPSGFSLTTGDSFTLTRSGDAVILSFSPVPEPATVLGLAAGALGLGGLVRRRLRRA